MLSCAFPCYVASQNGCLWRYACTHRWTEYSVLNASKCWEEQWFLGCYGEEQNRKKTGQPAARYNGASTGASLCPAWQCTTLGSHLRMARVNTAGGISVDLGVRTSPRSTHAPNERKHAFVSFLPKSDRARKHCSWISCGPPRYPKCSNLVQSTILTGVNVAGILQTARLGEPWTRQLKP